MSCSSAGLWVGGMCASVRAMCVHVHVMHMGTARAACGTCISPPSMEILSLYNLFVSQTHSVECAQWLVSWRGALQPGLRARENGCLLEKPRKNPRYLAVVLKVLPRVRYRLTTMNQLVDPHGHFSYPWSRRKFMPGLASSRGRFKIPDAKICGLKNWSRGPLAW